MTANDAHNLSNSSADSKPRMNSTSSVSFAEADLRNLGLEARSSSPAKRTRSERDEEDSQPTSQDMQLDGTMKGPRSPKKTFSQHASPMPNRLKVMNVSDTDAMTTVDTVMEEDDAGNKPSAYSVATSDDSSTIAQGQTISNTSTSVSSPPTSVENGDVAPSIDEQVRQIDAIINKELSEGLEGFLVPKKWLSRLRSRTTQGQSEHYSKASREGDIGPVDPSDLASQNILSDSTSSFVPLKPGVRYPEDFEVLPKAAWELVLHWYGRSQGAPAIRRFAHDTSPPGAEIPNLQWELNPPICTLQKLRKEAGGAGLDSLRDRELQAVKIVASRSELFSDFLKRVKPKLGIEDEAKVRVWKMIEPLPTNIGRSGMPTPMSSRDTSPAPTGVVQTTPDLLVEPSTLLAMTEGTQREMLNYETSPSDTIDSFGFADIQTLLFEQEVRLLSGATDFITDEIKKNSQNDSTTTSTKQDHLSVQNATKQKANTGSTRRSPTPSGILTRGRATKKGKSKGATGLQNLGNTCYMNSALQCIRSIEELTIFFLSDRYKEDLNVDNPLGHHGQIAKVYQGLLSSIYENVGSFSPRNFKATIGKVQPLFSGYGQQDSQEFLSFLVDALHEDLNRIKKKPYIENPESDDKTVHDPDAIKDLGEKFRSNHQARNDSVAMDLFNGFYKNTMVCPECDKVSITFDPYSALTVQLPIESTWQFKVELDPIRGDPIWIHVDIDKNSTIRSIKQYIAQRVPGLNAANLVMAEEYSKKFYKIFEDAEVVSEANIEPDNHIVFYELDKEPTNWPPLDKKRSKPSHSLGIFSVGSKESIPRMDSPKADCMAVPILHRLNNGNRYEFKQYPSFVLIEREEAKDYDRILRKLLQKVETMTTKDMLFEEVDVPVAGGSIPDRSDTVSMSEEDGSSDEQKVQARSVESEDGIVEVSMQNNGFEGKTAMESLRRTTNSKVLDPSYPIHYSYMEMFDIKIFGGQGDLIPTGYSSITERDTYPLLESRLPQRAQQGSSSESWDSNSATSSEDELQRNVAFSNPVDSYSRRDTTRTRSISSTGEDTPSKMDEVETSDQKDSMRPAEQSPTVEKDEDYLIRLGEGLILDWKPDAFDALFGKTDENDTLRGQYVTTSICTLPDPATEERKLRRQNRKKNGVTLYECFDETSKSEVLSEENAWYCNRCKELRRATKTLEIWTVPDILVVHLKRFGSNSRLRDKMDVFVDFPLEGLDLTRRVGLPEGKSLIYDCFAVDNHYGGLGGGHYTATAKNFFDKRWYNYNDTFVSPCEPKEAVSKAAYLLFYRRRTDGPLGPPYLRELVEEAWTPRSRSASPSGEDQRRDGSLSPNGSSSGSRAAAAEVTLRSASSERALGSAGAALDPTVHQKITMGDRDLDEGISMDPDEPLHSYEESGRPLPYEQHWSWDGIPTQGGTSAPPASDNDSIRATNDNLSDDEGMLDQDGVEGIAPLWSAPNVYSAASEEWDDNDAMDIVPTQMEQREDEVAEVRVDDDKGN